MGTGNGSNKDFTTAQPGVGIIVEVSLNGLKKKAGTDYTVSQMNDPALGAIELRKEFRKNPAAYGVPAAEIGADKPAAAKR